MGAKFGELLHDACVNILTVAKGAVYICMSSSELDTLQKAFRGAGGHWSTFVIWAKNTFTLGRSDYQRQYEPILYAWKDGADHYWRGARDQGDVWFIDKPAKHDLHPTMKPIELVERAIGNSSKSRDIVFDPFGGSGTTLIVAERSGRRARPVELDPKYVDVIVQRWQDRTRQNRKHCYPCADRRVIRKPTNAQLNQHSLNIRCVPGARMRSPYQNKCKGLTVSELVLNTFLHGEL